MARPLTGKILSSNSPDSSLVRPRMESSVAMVRPTRREQLAASRAVRRKTVNVEALTWALMDAGSEILPHLHSLASMTAGNAVGSDAWHETARGLWKLLRVAWAAWWPLRTVMEPMEAHALWWRCCGDYRLWQDAGCDRLLEYWHDRDEPPYKMLNAEWSWLAAWLDRATLGQSPAPDEPPTLTLALSHLVKLPF